MAKEKFANHTNNHRLFKGAVINVNLPNASTPDIPGEKIRRAMIWNIHRDASGKPENLDLMWISNSGPLESLKHRFAKNSHHVTDPGHYMQMGYDNPIALNPYKLINVKIDRNFFPKVKQDEKARICWSTASKMPVKIVGAAPEGLVKTLCALPALNDNAAPQTPSAHIGKGSVVMVRLPHAKTPHTPGTQARPALVFDVKKDAQNKITHLELMWMRKFSQSNEIADILSERHIMVTRPDDYKRLASDKPVLIDAGHTITVPATQEFFPKPSPKLSARICKDAAGGAEIIVLGKASGGLMHGVIAKVLAQTGDRRAANELEKTVEQKQKSLKQIEAEFNLNPLKL